jgi:exodeoxyribonuclease VII large subunit
MQHAAPAASWTPTTALTARVRTEGPSRTLRVLDTRLVPPVVPPEDHSLSFDFTPKAPRAPDPPPAEPRPLSVADLDRAIKGAVEDAFSAPVWVEGEVTGARPAPSGHLYFCLKDEREEAAIDVVMYRASVTPRMRALCVDGARLRLRGKPTLWAPRGRLQFIADRLQASGRGALLEAIERLKTKLAAEGLFAPERKRALPAEARVIGVVTSASGAVIHDICRVAFRRGGARILLAPAQVQGAVAVESICRALSQLQRVRDVDVIVLGRGGGSSDDLNAFNEEAIVRAVAGCRVPVISAVGHDMDVTLVDFAADARAATPSQAAEMVVPDRRAQRELLRRTELHLARAMHGQVAHQRVAHDRVARRLGDPRLVIAAHQQTLDDRLARLTARARSALARRREGLSQAQRRLAALHPRAVLLRERAEMSRLGTRLGTLWSASFARRAAELQRATARLDAYSPLKVLARGYAIATREDGRAIRSGGDVGPGETIHVRVSDARLRSVVEHVEPVDPLDTGRERP